MKYTLGIDIGTGSSKAVAVNTSGDIIYSTHVSYPTLNPQPHFCEQAPELIWQAFVKCVLRTSTAINEKPSAIVLSSVMHSVIPVDVEGNPMMNMITWADNRSADIARRIKSSTVGREIYSQTGTAIHAMSPLCKVLWLKENMPEIFSGANKYVSIKEYIWHKLFATYEVDHSIASATGLFDLNTLQWNKSALEVCGIYPDQLSVPVPVAHTRELTTMAAPLNMPTGTPVLIGSSDGCLANLGSFAISPGIAAVTIGTSGAIRMGSPKPAVNYRAMTFSYCLFDNLFISGGPINNGGIALKWYAENILKMPLNSAEDYEVLLEQIMDIEAGAKGVVFLPYVLGERAPIWDSKASALFVGLRNYHTQRHLTRAVIEGISMALYSVLRAMEESGLTVDKIHVSGGFVHSKIWLQILADIFNKDIYLVHQEDASAIGAAYLGLVSTGLVNTYDELEPSNKASFHPNEKDHKVYQKIFPIYERLYQKLEDEMHLLSEL